MQPFTQHTIRFVLTLTVLMLLFQPDKAWSQNNKTPTAAWILPGISYQHSQRLQFLGQYGSNEFLDAKAVYLQGFYDIGKHITLNPAYLYLNFTPDNTPHQHEHTWMQAIIFKAKLHRIQLENRGLFWNRLRSEQEDLFYYRNRLRISTSLGKENSMIKLYLFDEPWFLFTRGRWIRNRLAAGIIYRPAEWLQTDVSFALENDHYNGRTNIFFIMATLPIRNKKLFLTGHKK